MQSRKIPDKNLITPDRRDILSEPETLPSGAEPEPEACPADIGGGVRPAAGPAYRLLLSMKWNYPSLTEGLLLIIYGFWVKNSYQQFIIAENFIQGGGRGYVRDSIDAGRAEIETGGKKVRQRKGSEFSYPGYGCR